MTGLTLGLIALIQRYRQSGAKPVTGWWLLAGLFVSMSADDGAKIHERIGSAFDLLAGPAGAARPASAWGRPIEVFPTLTG